MFDILENSFHQNCTDNFFCNPTFYKKISSKESVYFELKSKNQIAAKIFFSALPDSKWRSPGRGTYSGYVFDDNLPISDLFSFHQSVCQTISKKGGKYIEILLPPQSHDPVSFSKQFYMLLSDGFFVSRCDLNYSLNINSDNFLDRSFGVLQYDAQWLSDITAQKGCTRGFLAMIPKFLKCQKEYYPTPLSTLQKMTIEFLRPNGELLSASSDTFNIGGIIAPQNGLIVSTTFPFNVDTTTSSYSLLKNNSVLSTSPANFFLNTSTYFSRFELCAGDRIQIKGYTYSDVSLNDPTYGQSLRAFCNWVNRNEGHIILNTAYTLNNTSTVLQDGVNDVGYANFVILQAPYQDPSTGSTLLQSFGEDFGRTLCTYGPTLGAPIRLINLNKQLNLVFRIITREMDSLPQIRPDNNY